MPATTGVWDGGTPDNGEGWRGAQGSSLSALPPGKDRLLGEGWPRPGRLRSWEGQQGRARGEAAGESPEGRATRGRTGPAAPLPDPAWGAPVLGEGRAHVPGVRGGEDTAGRVHGAAPGNPASEIGRS